MRVGERVGIAGCLIGCYPHGNLDLSAEDDPVWQAIAAGGAALHIHVKLVDIGVDVAASCREVRKAAKKLASGSALGAAVAGAHYLYVLNKIAL